MAGTIVICEKHSQSVEIRAAIGNRFGPVYPASGHLLRLVEPEAISDEWKKWRAELLWNGKPWPKEPIPRTVELFNTIARALKSADHVVVATDCDREGQVISDEILEFCRYQGKVSRVIFNATDPKSLQDAFAKMEPNANYFLRYQAGRVREQADKITGYSYTRAASSTFMAPGSTGAIGIGRVKTPTLGIVCERELEILNFKPQDLYEVIANTRVSGGVLDLSCSKLPSSVVPEETEEEESADEELEEGEEALEEPEPLKGRIVDRALADGLLAAAKAHAGPISMKSEKKRQSPPKLFDQTALQTFCTARFGWSPQQTLELAQELYSQPLSLITYPRGESQHLPENDIANVPGMVAELLKTGDYGNFAAHLEKPIVRKGKTGHFSDAANKGLSHYALAPNFNSAHTFARVYPTLRPELRNLFDVIAKQYMAALSPDFEYRQTSVEMLVPFRGHQWSFRNSGRVPLVMGWRDILGGGGKGDDADLPVMQNGETAQVIDARLKASQSRPPSRYSDGALVRLMKEAWRTVPKSKPQLRERLKAAKGIGTGATRAPTVQSLIDQGQLKKSGKVLVPHPGALEIYKTLRAIVPNIVDPARTAVWETLFDKVEAGENSFEEILNHILKDAEKEIGLIKNASVQVAFGRKRKPTEKMVQAAKRIAEMKKIKPPAGYLTDAEICGNFLSAHLPKRAEGEAPAPGKPTEAQLKFANSIATRLGRTVPAEAMESSQTLSKWIDAQGAVGPSEKQLALAEKLAGENSIKLPADVKTDGRKCSEFIGKYMGKKKSGSGKSGYSGRSATPAPRPRGAGAH